MLCTDWFWTSLFAIFARKPFPSCNMRANHFPEGINSIDRCRRHSRKTPVSVGFGHATPSGSNRLLIIGWDRSDLCLLNVSLPATSRIQSEVRRATNSHITWRRHKNSSDYMGVHSFKENNQGSMIVDTVPARFCDEYAGFLAPVLHVKKTKSRTKIVRLFD